MATPAPANPADTLARTLYGEARGTGAAGMKHIANVVLNRVNLKGWMGSDIVSVCRKPYQFSCWNATDPNYSKILTVTASDPVFKIAQQIAQQAVAGQLLDETRGADSYFALTMRIPPAWARTGKKVYADGWHAFYKTVPETHHTGNQSIHGSSEDLNAAVLAGTYTPPTETVN